MTTPTSKTTNFAEIAAGFLAGLEPLGPLMRGMSELQGLNPPPSLILQLQDPDKKFFIAPAEKPMVVQVNGEDPDANLYMVADAEMFHHLLWGQLTLAKAVNEKLILMESRRPLPPEDQPPPVRAGGPILFNNLLYEMHLIRIGAGHLIANYAKPKIPLPGEPRPIKEITLEKTPGKTALGTMANAAGRVLGWMAGIALRLYFKLRKQEDLEAPLEYSSIPDPRPTTPPPSSGARLAVMKFLFRRIDILSVLDNLAKGVMDTGPFKPGR